MPIIQLSGKQRVETIDLSQQGLGPASALVVVKAMQNNSVLTSLDMLGNDIGVGAKAVVDAVQDKAHITTLCGSRPERAGSDFRFQCNHGDAILIAFDLQRHSHSQLMKLDLKSGSIGNLGAAALAEALKVNASLKTLVCARFMTKPS